MINLSLDLTFLSRFSISLLRFSLGALTEKGTRQKTLQLACEELQKGNLFFMYWRLNISDKPAKNQLKENGLQMYILLNFILL